jgi:hypothetical protein
VKLVWGDGAGAGAGVGVEVEVGAPADEGAVSSKAPMSQLLVVGRATPRWSVA